MLIASAAMAYAGDISEEGKEGRVMAMINVAIFTGVGTGPILGGILSHNFGGASIFYVLSALAALAFLITLFSLPETEKPILKESGFTHLRNLIKKDILKVLVVWGVSAPMGIALVISFIPILAARSGLLPTQVGIIISACVFLIALLQEPFGRLADKVTPYKKIFLLFTGQLIVSVALLFTPACRSMAALFIVTGVVGLGTAIAYPVGSEIAVLVGRRAGMGSCIGLVTASKGAGTAITPLVAGLVMDTFGLNAVFYIVAILILVCKLICYYYTSRWLESHR